MLCVCAYGQGVDASAVRVRGEMREQGIEARRNNCCSVDDVEIEVCRWYVRGANSVLAMMSSSTADLGPWSNTVMLAHTTGTTEHTITQRHRNHKTGTHTVLSSRSGRHNVNARQSGFPT